MCTKTYLPLLHIPKNYQSQNELTKKTKTSPKPWKTHIKCPKLASAPSSSAACTSSMEPGRSDWQACGGWWFGWLETCDDLVGRLDGEIWTSQKKNGEKIWVDPPSWECLLDVFFFVSLCSRCFIFVGRNNGCVDQIAWELSSIGLGRKIIAILRLKRIRWMNSIENQTS